MTNFKEKDVLELIEEVLSQESEFGQISLIDLNLENGFLVFEEEYFPTDSVGSIIFNYKTGVLEKETDICSVFCQTIIDWIDTH